MLAPGVARGAWAGLCACLIGIGLARFAYTPLIPVLIGAGWFAPGEAAYLGAANLAGYLVGALLAAPIARRVPAARVLRFMMVLVGIAFLACAIRLPFAWFFAWRFAAGLAGGTLMALAAPTVMAITPGPLRGRIGGIMFSGVGIGVVVAGTLLPLLIRARVEAAWIALGMVTLALAASSWNGWPAAPLSLDTPTARPSGGAWALILQYGLCSVGLVPHMVFLVDFVARGLGRGVDLGAVFFLVYGAGALVGPLAAGFVSDRIGFRRALHWALPVQAIAVALPLLSTHGAVLALSSFIVGAFTPGIVSVVMGRAQEIAGGDPLRHRAIWGAATASFGAFQAIAAYRMAFMFARSDGAYATLFTAGSAALILACLLDVWPMGGKADRFAAPSSTRRPSASA